MRIGFLADIHVANHKRFGGMMESGLNKRCASILATMRKAMQKARDENVDTLYILGDLFDTTRPEPQVIRAVQEVLTSARPHTVILLGNHEQVSDAGGDHALGPLAPVARIVESASTMTYSAGVDVLVVPFQPGDAREWLPREVASLVEDAPVKKKRRVLLTHLGLAEDDTPAYMRDGHDVVPMSLVEGLCAEHGIEAVFAGNWHFHKMLRTSPIVCQVGALVPTGFDNPGTDGLGSLVVWDSETKAVVRHEIPGPRFIKTKFGDPFSPSRLGEETYVSITAYADQQQAARDMLGSWKAAGAVGGEVVIDDLEARIAARSAAAVACSAETLDGALAGFVAQMPLPDGVAREEVLAAARRYLGRGQ